MKKTYRRKDGYSISALAHAANDHLVSAMHLFIHHGPQTYDSAGYLAHLGVELLLKAGLLQRTSEFPNSHSLRYLATSLASNGVRLGLSTSEEHTLTLLDSWASLRYPSPAGLPPLGTENWSEVHALYRSLLHHLPRPIKQAIQRIDHTKKSGRTLTRAPQRRRPTRQ